MDLPFSTEDFLAVFRAYNLAVWPAQIGLFLLAIVLISFALFGAERRQRWVVAITLAILWAWMGAVYHLAFFADINPAARAFAILFLGQAAIWVIWARRTPGLSFRPAGGIASAVGAGLLTYALLVYPLLNVASGHGYPAMPTFGLPCPTTIATFGLLAWATPRPPWYVWIVPIIWAVVGTSAAFVLGIHEDLGLAAAAILAVTIHLRVVQARRTGPHHREEDD